MLCLLCIAYFPEPTMVLMIQLSAETMKILKRYQNKTQGAAVLTSTEPFNQFFFALSWPLRSFANSSVVGYGTWAGSWFGNDEASEALLSGRLLNLITELMHTAREKNIH